MSNKSSTYKPAPKRRGNIRTMPANRMIYLLDNYPADIAYIRKIDGAEIEVWSEAQVLRAMQAAFNAGKRAAKRSEV